MSTETLIIQCSTDPMRLPADMTATRLLWNFKGLTRLVPDGVIQNVRDRLADYAQNPHARDLPPKDLDAIWWDQTVDVEGA